MVPLRIQSARNLVGLFIIAAVTWNCTTTAPPHLTPESMVIRDQFSNSKQYLFRHLLADTEYETPVFRFRGEETGPVVLIIGGTHGNEPAGYEAVHRLLKILAEMNIKTGEVFIIPEANRLADLAFTRRIKTPCGVDKELGNLNRCYPGNSHGLPMQRLAFQITKMIKEFGIDVVVDLHESPVFHLEYMENSGQYHGLGQTLIYTPNEAATWTAMVLLDEMNSAIPPGLEQFSLAARPVQHSAAWSAGEFFGIPGFITETCKKLPLETRVAYQIKMVKIILREAGIF